MLILSLAGILLQANVEHYKGVVLLIPVLTELAGYLDSICTPHMSIYLLHTETIENYRVIEYIMLAKNIPVQIVLEAIIWGESI
ncbi:uncharacterized protein BX663DRAFT_505333 [Cokeromyces recurvatus]|uniref:uncharacterized protein n=1 Tax=Cokeromyces recurvatus TaxID=90255 RepID=UPI00221F3B79|nr:uncharacterized protein BX663DRAFT_505333 [Cokeromyces recurvatus]KAI7903821.1 hypothetical protein BX663DRAFT_505333 [Cokeromyces recurvatus]